MRQEYGLRHGEASPERSGAKPGTEKPSKGFAAYMEKKIAQGARQPERPAAPIAAEPKKKGFADYMNKRMGQNTRPEGSSVAERATRPAPAPERAAPRALKERPRTDEIASAIRESLSQMEAVHPSFQEMSAEEAAEVVAEAPPPSPAEQAATQRRIQKELREAAFNDAGERGAEQYKPRFLAMGGEHAVFNVRGGDGSVVVKANLPQIAEFQQEAVHAGLPADGLTELSQFSAERALKHTKARNVLLQKHFGRSRMLPSRQSLERVPVNEEVLREAYGGKVPDAVKGATEAWTVVTMQRKAKELSGPHLDIAPNYAEKYGAKHPESYQRATDALVELREDVELSDEDVEKVFAPAFADLLQRAEKSPALKEMLKDFVERAIAYTNDTGDILDIAGSNNIVISEKNGKLRYRLLDVHLAADNIANWAKDALTRHAKDGAKPSMFEQGAVLNALSYTRGVNMLARRTGSKARLDIVPPEAKGKVDYKAFTAELMGAQR